LLITLPSGAEAVAQLSCEQHRLLKCSEVTAAVELVPIDEMGIEPLGPAARRGNDLKGENAAAYGNVDDAGIAADSRVLKVDARRRGRRFRQPIERDVVEHFVARKR
jgi:hypothetical protein